MRLNFPLLSDANRDAIPAYGVLLPELAGIKNLANRAVFVVDSTGVVRYKWLAQNPPQIPNVDEILSSIEKL